MAVQVKRRRRIAILLVCAVVLVVGTGGFYVFRKHQIRTELNAMRAEGMALLEEQQYHQAMHTLGRYLKRRQEDAEATYAYYQAQLNVPASDGRHLANAIGVLKRLQDLQPDHPTVKKELFDLYVQVGFHSETYDLAREMLVQDPNDVEVVGGMLQSLLGLRRFKEAVEFADAQLQDDAQGQPVRAQPIRTAAIQAKARALTGEQRFDQALELALRYNELEPLDIEGHLLTFQLLMRLERPVEQLVDRAKQLHDQHSDDPTPELLLAIAHRLTNQRDEAVAWLRSVADRELDEQALVARLVSELDMLGEYRKATEALEQAYERINNVTIKHQLILRLIQAGREEAALTLLEKEKLDLDSPIIDDELIALKAMALIQIDRRQEAEPIIEKLTSRSKNDKVAQAWSAYLRLLTTPEDLSSPTRSKEICQTAISHYRNNPYLFLTLGQAYWSMGEVELAIDKWRQACMLSPAWAKPWELISQALLATDRLRDAMLTAREAVKRSSDKTRQAYAESSQSSKSLRVFLLARAGKIDEAKASLQELLAGDETLDEQQLLQLTAISRTRGMGLEQECLERYEELFGVTPASAYERAIQLLAQGQAQEGLEGLEASIQEASDTDDANAWQLVRARYLEAMRDPGAGAAWSQLGDKATEDLNVQRQLLESASAWEDMDLIDRTIHRLTQLTGEDGLRWRVARARWILQSEPELSDLNTAVDLLTDVITRAPARVDARVLLAQNYLAMKNQTAAIEQLEFAARLAPRSPQIALDLARLYEARGDADKARGHLTAIIEKQADMSDQVLRVTADLLIKLGDTDKAIALLERMSGGEEDSGVEDLALAQLYWRQNEPEKVESLCRKILEKPTAAGIRFVSNFYASNGRMEEADQALALLDAMTLEPAARELIRAQFMARYVGGDQAVDEFQAAVNAAPDNPDIRRQLVQYLIGLGRIDDAVASAHQAAVTLAGDDAVAFFLEHEKLVTQAGGNVLLRPIIADLLAEESRRQIAGHVLTTLIDAEQEQTKAKLVLNQLRPVVDQNPQYLALQILMTQLSMRYRQYDDAATQAVRALAVSPNNQGLSQIHAEALAASGRWSEALVAAQKWRELTPDQPLAADLMIAESQFQLKNTAAAGNQIKPYIDQAIENPQDNAQLIGLQARVLLATDRQEQAKAMLGPLLDRSASWRQLWIRLALSGLLQPSAAVEWLNEVERHIPAEQLEERTLLVQSWLSLSSVLESSEYRRRGMELLAALVEEPEAPASVWLMHAIGLEQEGQLKNAERNYRKVLQLNPESHIAKNNLAMLLAQTDANLEEAQMLASAAIDAQPSVASYHDTLSFVLTKLGDYPAAIASLREAIRLDPGNPIWLKNLDQLLNESGQSGEDAQGLLDSTQSTVTTR